MQVIITLPDILPKERVSQLIKKMEEFFTTEGIPAEIQQDVLSDDPWDNLNIDEIAVDAGIEDFAENHDRYLYGLKFKTSSKKLCLRQCSGKMNIVSFSFPEKKAECTFIYIAAAGKQNSGSNRR